MAERLPKDLLALAGIGHAGRCFDLIRAWARQCLVVSLDARLSDLLRSPAERVSIIVRLIPQMVVLAVIVARAGNWVLLPLIVQGGLGALREGVDGLLGLRWCDVGGILAWARHDIWRGAARRPEALLAYG